MPINQPTILVKKADGSFARMTLEEINRMRGGGAPTAVQTTVPKSVIPVKTGIQSSVMPLDSGSRSGMTIGRRDDSRPKDDSRKNKPLVISTRANPVEEVLKKLRFQVPEQLQNRLRSIIQLHLKDIRSAEQTKDKVVQPAAEGGLGLVESEAGELVSVCGIILDREMKNQNLDNIPVLKKKNLLPMVEPKEIPAVATPFNAFVHGEMRRLDLPTQSGSGMTTMRGNDSMRRGDDKRDNRSVLSAKPTIKMAMEDVQAPRPVEMGPVEEIQYMTLVDFRRLSAKPVEAAARLKQKFLNLRDESVVLYMDAFSAWHKSPLYADYMKNVARALKEKRKMSALDGEDANKIKLEEILAIVGMEKEFE